MNYQKIKVKNLQYGNECIAANFKNVTNVFFAKIHSEALKNITNVTPLTFECEMKREGGL